MDKSSFVEMDSTSREVKDFIDSFVWKDMKANLTRWLNDMNEVLDNADDMTEIYRTQGRKQAIQFFLQEPYMMLEALEENLNQKDLERGE